MWPQNFKKYVFEAENDLGSRTFEVTLKKGKQRQPLNVRTCKSRNEPRFASCLDPNSPTYNANNAAYAEKAASVLVFGVWSMLRLL